jgi:glycosyltransferase involved in cell wall biosynthesis
MDIQMSVGVAIPTYVKHAVFLQSLLENITSSTIPPDRISVSCSSVQINKQVEFTVNSVPVVARYTTATLNPSENRNIAASMLDTEFISFIDGDDLMHPQRLEYVKEVFLNNPSVGAVYHAYEVTPLADRNLSLLTHDAPDLSPNSIVQNPGGLGVVVQNEPATLLHHAHVTVRASVFSNVKFDESPRYKYLEDSIYASSLVSNQVGLAYLRNKLTRYISGCR